MILWKFLAVKMSSSSINSPERSVSVSSPLAADGTIVESASSTRRFGPPPGVTVQHIPVRPNVTFRSRQGNVRARSASPRPRRTVSPIALSVAQERARTAEQRAETALSGVEVVADRTKRAQAVAEDAIAEARSVCTEVASRMAEAAKRADVSASAVAEDFAGKVRETVAHAEATTSRAVGELESKTREYVEGHRRVLETKIEQNQAETRRTAQETRAAVDQLSTQLTELTTKLAAFQPARSADVVQGQQQLSQDVSDRLRVHSIQVNDLSETVQKMEKDNADNTKLLHDLLVNMENLGETVKQMRTDFMNWDQEELPVETEEDRLHKEMNAAILQEVSLSVPHTDAVNDPSSMTPVSMPVSTSTQILNLSSPSSMPENMDQQMKTKFDQLKQPAVEKIRKISEKGDSSTRVNVDTIVSTPLPNYPGLDGHPRRITPIPLSIPISPVKVEKLVKPDEREAKRMVTERTAAEEDTATSYDHSGTNMSTIGNTFIPPEEERRIREQVRTEMRQLFPGIQIGTIHNSGSGKSGVNQANPNDEKKTSVPLAIAGSEVSLASTSNNGGNAVEFSRLSQQAGAGVQPQMFATTQWKPKEPPCFYGRSSEDVHTWTSLVRHYLTFMGGSDAQQVSYAITLLREHAHEWFMGYERRNRHLPRDWASLASALLERFGSNIRSQEAQSQLMSISQGTRPVREYASQFELLIGRLDSYDEGMLLNQFVWGLQPEIARSVSLHYPKSIAQAVSLAETTELATKSSRRPVAKGAQSGKAPTTSNRGRGQWRGQRGRFGRGGRGGGRRGGNSGGSRGAKSGTGSYDPLACYRCGVRGHLARDCPQNMQSQGGSNAGSSRGKFSQSVQRGTKGRGRGGRQVRFSALNVLYDDEGNQYPVDDAGQLYVPLESGHAAVEGENEEEKINETKN